MYATGGGPAGRAPSGAPRSACRRQVITAVNRRGRTSNRVWTAATARRSRSCRLEYGFSRAFALGNLHDARLRDLAGRWRGERLAEFRRVCRSAYERLTGETDIPYSNWYELVAAEAEAAVVS
jgi:hypothetical protein